MTIALVQTKAVANGTPTMDSGCGTGNLLIAVAGYRSTAGTIPGGWTQVGSTVDCNGMGDDGPIIMAKKITTPGETAVGTWTHTGSIRVCVMEFSGVSSSVYASGSSDSQAQSSHPVLSAISAQAGQNVLIVAAFTQGQGTSNGMPGYSPDSGYTEVDDAQVEPVGGGPRMTVIYQLVNPASSSYTPGVTGGNLIWGGVGATFTTGTPINLALQQAIVVM